MIWTRFLQVTERGYTHIPARQLLVKAFQCVWLFIEVTFSGLWGAVCPGWRVGIMLREQLLGLL
jgi:hypothetical protein